MTQSQSFTILLFSYGTLQDKAVQLANFGRELTGQADQMIGYKQSYVEITDPQVLAESGKTHHPIISPSADLNDTVSGTVYQITPQELAAADAYEVSDYKRIAVGLVSGLTAWVYVEA
ncbi:gamma-glutamylcyclotransferase family protein [Pseudomonas sp. RGM 3321]|uniref:gamma-glutamylcyclotransferase family protein n=1 Tax=Pseudomonas sp. RGM 3321 TaxID=2930089 RepID=UPI001FCABC73|nr:gamma-glutamylcyclotransferase family protein [Pseudomonas sp. RGM 3321]MCJ2373899.1 gamma-glutamylcyclotransferase [Pseudomonas sp. RGM 3321]